MEIIINFISKWWLEFSFLGICIGSIISFLKRKIIINPLFLKIYKILDLKNNLLKEIKESSKNNIIHLQVCINQNHLKKHKKFLESIKAYIILSQKGKKLLETFCLKNNLNIENTNAYELFLNNYGSILSYNNNWNNNDNLFIINRNFICIKNEITIKIYFNNNSLKYDILDSTYKFIIPYYFKKNNLDSF